MPHPPGGVKQPEKGVMVSFEFRFVRRLIWHEHRAMPRKAKRALRTRKRQASRKRGNAEMDPNEAAFALVRRVTGRSLKQR